MLGPFKIVKPKMNEKNRIATLKKYRILDTPKDRAFDYITKLATTTLGTPIALISMVDTERIWFKSAYGADVTEIAKEDGFCSTTILGTGLHIIEDAKTNPSTKNNSLVTGEFGLRFYAAIPLTVEKGENLGTLCVIDTKPRTLNAKEQEILKDLGRLVVEQLETQLSIVEAVSSKLEMSNMLHSIYENTKEASTFIDTDFKIRYSNKVSKNIGKQIFGKEEVIGENALDYVLPEYREEFENSFNRVLNGESIEVEKSEGTNWWRFAMYPVYNNLNVLVGIAHNVQDITTEKNNLLKLVQQNELLKRITWQQCHEVRGPVANILGFCSLLKDNPELNDYEKKSYINHLYDATKDLDKIIHEIVGDSIANYKEI